MKPYTQDLNVDLINEGTLLRRKNLNVFYLVLSRSRTILHKHLYFKCLEMRSRNYLVHYKFKEINKIILREDDLKDLEEVKI